MLSKKEYEEEEEKKQNRTIGQFLMRKLNLSFINAVKIVPSRSISLDLILLIQQTFSLSLDRNFSGIVRAAF